MAEVIDQTGFDLGLPRISTPWWGLWSPVLDCFLLVSDHAHNLQRIRALTLGRIYTVIVELDKQLFVDNVIDNLCVENWTLLDCDIKNFCSDLKDFLDRPKISQLQPAGATDTDRRIMMANWFRFVWRHVRDLENTDVNDAGIMADFLGGVFGRSPDFGIKNKIYQILLLEDDMELAQIKIQQVLQQDV